MTEKMLARAGTFGKGQKLDQELLHMVLDDLVEIGIKQLNGGYFVLCASLTEKGFKILDEASHPSICGKMSTKC
jgi:hypothetical protein